MTVVADTSPAGAWLAGADATALARRSRTENFPVASLLLPSRLRGEVAAVYAVARLIDEAGDSAPAELRPEILDRIEHELRYGAETPVLQAIPARLDPQPFLDLVEAQRVDQVVTAYATRDDLLGYCALSAAPVGRLVLDLLDLATPERQAWSDAICAGLQVAEHLQDVGEDLAAGRVYVPAASLERHGVTRELLTSGGPWVADLLADEAAWARSLLDAGTPLVRSVPGRARYAVAAFVAGGHAALDAVLRAGASAVSVSPRPGRRTFARRLREVLR